MPAPPTPPPPRRQGNAGMFRLTTRLQSQGSNTMVRYYGMDAIALVILMASFFIAYSITSPEAMITQEKPHAFFNHDVDFYMHPHTGELEATTEGAERHNPPPTPWRRYLSRQNPLIQILTTISEP